MSRIWKYPIPIVPRFTLVLPRGSRVLAAQVQDGEPMVWALVPDASANADVERRFRIVGTGQEFDPTALNYVATFQLGPFVWHLFEEPPF